MDRWLPRQQGGIRGHGASPCLTFLCCREARLARRFYFIQGQAVSSKSNSLFFTWLHHACSSGSTPLPPLPRLRLFSIPAVCVERDRALRQGPTPSHRFLSRLNSDSEFKFALRVPPRPGLPPVAPRSGPVPLPHCQWHSHQQTGIYLGWNS